MYPMAAVLMYHRISAPTLSDPWGLAVSPEHFSEHLDLLRSDYEVISLQELCSCHRDGRIPDRAVCITFDDGYYDNLTTAKPLLERAQLPATVFLATGFLGTPHYWWDRLVALFAQIETQGLSANAAADGLGLRPPVTLENVWRRIRDLPPEEREATLDGVTSALNLSGRVQVHERPMTHEEAKRLVSPLISIGAHTVGHVWLPALGEAQVLQEMRNSIEQCEEIAGETVPRLAYPYGAYNDMAKAAAASLGIECAVTTNAAAVTIETPLLALPRIAVPDCHAEDLERRLMRAAEVG